MKSVTGEDIIRVAGAFMGLSEIPGVVSNRVILNMLSLDAKWPKDDETPWCSAFVNWVAHMLSLERSRSLAARSWLNVGKLVDAKDPSFWHRGDVVILRSPGGPGAEVTSGAPGHVGFFAALTVTKPLGIHLLGGNQSNMVTISTYSLDRVIGVRRIAE